MNNLELKINESIAKGLMEEGYNPLYVDAMLRKGLNLGTAKPIIGDSYCPERHWKSNLRRALDSTGIKVEERLIRKYGRMFKSMKLITEKAKKPETCISLNPKWADVTYGSLRDYLTAILYP